MVVRVNGFLADKALTLLMLVVLAVLTASARVIWIHTESIAELRGLISGDEKTLRRLDTTLESVREMHDTSTSTLENMVSVVDSYRAHVVLDSTQTARHDERLKSLEVTSLRLSKKIGALGVVVNARTTDRYYAADAKRDNKIIINRFAGVDSDLSGLQNAIIRLDDVDRKVLIRLGIMENGKRSSIGGRKSASMTGLPDLL